jgi:hypothetical protein
MFAGPRCLLLVLALISLALPACLPPAAPPAASSQALLLVKPDRLSFVTREGNAGVSEQVISVSSAGMSQMDWSISDTSLWIILEQAVAADDSSGSTVKVRLDASGLAPGSYMGLITVQARAALNSPVFVPVSLSIVPAAALQQQPPAIAVQPPASNDRPTEADVLWQNRVAFAKYALVNACVVTGSVTNTDRTWHLSDVNIVSGSGNSVNIAQDIPPGETVMYRRYIPCYRTQEVSLKYNWQDPR